MKVSGLRSFMQRFKVVGVLCVAIYLGMHHLWTKRRSLLLLSAFVLLGIGILFWEASSSSRSKHVMEAPSTQPGDTASTITTDTSVKATPGDEPEKENAREKEPERLHSSGPHLDEERLKHSYTPHRHDTEITVSTPEWSPDGRHAFYTIRERKGPESGETQSVESGETWNTLCSVRRDGSHIHPLFRWEDPGADHPDEDTIRWAPDSSHVILLALNFSPACSVNADGVKLFDFDPETGGKRDLTRPIDGKLDTGLILWRPGYYAFSPNGKSLLLTLGGDRRETTNKRLVRIEYATGKRTLLTSHSMASFAGCWSPDGNRIVYIALPDSGGSSETPLPYEKQWEQKQIYIMDADGNHKCRLAQDKGYFDEEPSWSADGKTLFFVRRSCEGWHPSLWKVRPDGTALTFVSNLPAKDE